MQTEKRKLDSHKVNAANDLLDVVVLDGEGPGGAPHAYAISGYEPADNPSCAAAESWGGTTLLFQNGPIGEAGVNGITHEALLAVLIDRLEHFQRGRYACEENGLALAHLRDAAAALHSRTQRRMAAGTEGTHKPD